MKKLIAIIASALTLGAFADAADTPIIVTGLDTAGITNGSTLTLVHDGEEVVSTTYNGESSMAFGTEGDGAYVITCDGTPVTEEIANTRGSAPKFASALPKMLASVEPVAVWNGFTNLTSGGYTWTNTGCTVDENGVLTIGKTEEGGGLSLDFGSTTPFYSGKTLTLALDIETPSDGYDSLTMIANILQNGSNVSIAANGDHLYQCWGATTNGGYGDCAWENGTRKVIVITYKGASGTGSGTRTYFDGAKKMGHSSLMTSSGNLTKLSIGSYHGVAETGAAIAEGMKVYRAALYATNLSETDAAAFTWPEFTEDEIFNGSLPGDDDVARFQNESWTGTVWIKNVSNIRDFDLDKYGNANSKLKLSGVSAFLKQGKPAEFAIGEVILVDEGETKALTINDGYSDDYAKIKKLSGSGTVQQSTNQCQAWWVQDMSEFTGTFTITGTGNSQGLRLVVADEYPYTGRTNPGSLYVGTGKTVTIPAGKEWRFEKTGYIIHGTLNVDAQASKQGLKDTMLIAEGGVVNIAQTDWIPYDATEMKAINVKGTLNLGTTRQTLKANNKINIYPGATITGTATGVDGGCHINTFGANCVISMVADGAKTDAATISAIIGPQGSAATIDVADGLTLNLAATASSTGSGRTNGLVKTGTGTLNITGKYNTLAGLTLNAGTIIVAEGATIPASGVVTTVQGKKVSCTDGVYTLVDDAPSAPGEEFIPEGEKAEYEAWAATNVPAGEYTTDQKANFAIAFHLGATINEGVTIEEAAQAKVKELVAQIDLAALADPEGGEEAALEALNDELEAKGLVASLAPVTLDGASETTKLYQLVIKLIEEN